MLLWSGGIYRRSFILSMEVERECIRRLWHIRGTLRSWLLHSDSSLAVTYSAREGGCIGSTV